MFSQSLFVLIIYCRFAFSKYDKYSFQNIKGDITPSGVYAKFGTRTVYAEDNRPGGRQSGCVLHHSNSIWVIGGSGYGTTLPSKPHSSIRLNDVWEFSLDPEIRKWRNWKGNEDGGYQNIASHDFHVDNNPGSWSHMTCFKDTAESVAYLSGGKVDISATMSNYTNEVWAFSFSSRSFKRIFPQRVMSYGTTGQFSGETTPPPWITWVNPGIGIKPQNMMVFGGYTSNVSYAQGFSLHEGGSSNELWEFDSSVPAWRHVRGPKDPKAVPNGLYNTRLIRNVTSIPPRRRSHSSFYVAKDHSFWLFGGLDIDPWIYERKDVPFYNDLWKYLIDEDIWIWVSGKPGGGIWPSNSVDDYIYNSENYPGASSGLCAWSMGEYIYVFGGHRWDKIYNQTDYSSLYLYSIAIDEWKFAYGYHGEFISTDIESHRPGSRDNSQFAIPIVNPYDYVYLFGGSCYNSTQFDQYCNDVWEISLFDCYQIAKYDYGKVCSGHGKCIAVDDCYCDEDYHGQQCSEYKPSVNGNNGNPLTEGLIVGIIVGSVSGSFFILLLVLILLVCLFCCFLIPLILLVFIICMFISISSITIFIQRMKIRKYGMDYKDGNLELLIKENELEKDSVINFQINPKLFMVPFEDVKLVKRLGSGGSNSTVFLAKWRGQTIAFKVFKTTHFSCQEYYDEFEQEIQIISNLHHPNIVSCYGGTLKPPRCGILLEYCPNGTIGDYITKNPEGMNMRQRIQLLKEVGFALDYLHNNSILHRDVKSENIMLSADLKPKLIDFGISKIVENMGSGGKTKRVGTSVYMAPEVVLSSKYNHKCDIYSFAIVMFEVVTGNFNPYEITRLNSASMDSIELRVANDPNLRPKFDDELKYPIFLVNLIKRCWLHNPEERPDMSEIIEKFEKGEEGNIEEYEINFI